MNDIMLYKNTVLVSSGLNRAANMIYRALQESKNLTVFPIDIKSPFKNVESKNHIKKSKYNLIFGIPNVFKDHVEHGKVNIGYGMWETDKVPDSFKPSLESLDLLVVPTDHNVDVFAPHCKKVIKIPIPYPFHSSGQIYKGKDRVYTFYTICTWIERKSPLEMLSAYFSEFDQSENVKMYMKIKHQTSKSFNMSKDVMKLINKNQHPDYEISEKLLSDKQIINIHLKNHCYVSLSKMEGWNFPLMDAYLSGNQIVSTHPQGVTEYFEKPFGFYPVSSNIGAVENMEWLGCLDKSHNWQIPDIDSARKQMRAAYEDWKQNPQIDINKCTYRNEKLINKMHSSVFIKDLERNLP